MEIMEQIRIESETVELNWDNENVISQEKDKISAGSNAAGRLDDMASSAHQHDDFGEKIGGAKKDLWKQRGLFSDDLSEMNSREADKFVKKDNVWKKPDYQAIIDSGVPFNVAYFIKKVRDSVNASPQYYRTDDTSEKRMERQKQYVDTIRELQGVMEGVKTKDDVMSAYAGFLIAHGYVERLDGSISGSRYYATQKGRENPVITNKLAQTLFVRSEKMFEYDFTRKATKEQFGVAKEQKIPKGFEISFYDGKNSYSSRDDWKTDTYFVTKGSYILKTNLDSRDAALKWAQELVRQHGNGRKKRFVPEQLANVRRDGPDYRGGRDASGQDYLEAFGFKGGEFGNWMSQNDRQASLNMGLDALKDLADALQITDKDISYQGVLSIAFGARGSGNAAAHYEPMRKVINLTKMHGAGSLAHEWWHGLDDFLGQRMGINNLLSENPGRYPLFAKLVETMKYKPETPEQAVMRSEKQNARTRHNAESWLDSIILSSLKRAGDEKALSEYARLKMSFLSGEPGTLGKLNDLKKSVSGHVIPKSDRDTLAMFESVMHSMADRLAPTIGHTETEYYRNSKKMGQVCEKDGGYWDSNTEMTARAFAVYVMDKLPGRSDYLVGHAECAVNIVFDKEGNPEILRAYPQGDERKAINAVFDEIIADLKLQKYLIHDDRPLSEQNRRAFGIDGWPAQELKRDDSKKERLQKFRENKKMAEMDIEMTM